MAGRRFHVDLAPAAKRQLGGLHIDARGRIIRALRALESDPRPPGAARLSELRGEPQWRIRVGDYRVIYEIHEKRLLVLVIRIGHRGKVYRIG